MILKTLPIIGGILFICYIFQAFCKYYVSCQGHIMGAQMERDMRRKLFDHYENLSFPIMISITPDNDEPSCF